MTLTDHAMHTLLWSECDDDGTPLDTIDARPSAELMQRVANDVSDFMDRAEALGFDAEQHRIGPINAAEGDAWDYAAHDFILTRNHHGAGFWDGDWIAPWGDRLTELAHTYGEINCYVGDDGFIYSL